MTTTIFKNAYIAINGVDYSSKANQVSLPMEVETQDATTFGDDTRKNVAGLKSWTKEIQFFNDFTDNGLDETLWGLWNAGTAVQFAVRPNNASKSPTNPEYSGLGLIKSITPISGGVGGLLGLSISVVSAGDLSRLTA